jgi:cytochrome c peroxidase
VLKVLHLGLLRFAFHFVPPWNPQKVSVMSELPHSDPRASVARGQAIFNSISIKITGVAGINDPFSIGGLLPNGASLLQGKCATCHDTPNVGNHSFPTPLDIGTGHPNPSNPSVNLGGLDISYLPAITVCKTDATPATCKTTTDLGQALIDGNYDHVGKIKGPILRGLSARAPYFHNGSAKTLLDAYDFTKPDLASFLRTRTKRTWSRS